MIEQIVTPTTGRDYLSEIPGKEKAALLPARVKLQAVLGMERFAFPLLAAGIFVVVLGIVLGPTKSSRGLIQPETSLIISMWIGGGLILSAALVRILVDNYYVLDTRSQRILSHRGLRFFGAERPFLVGDQVFAVGLNCDPRRARGGVQIGWIYTPVILIKDGRKLELSDWVTDMSCMKLPEFNDRIEKWASVLQCYCVHCPSERAFSVNDYFGQTNVR